MVTSSFTDFTEVGWREDQRKELCKIAAGFVTANCPCTFEKVVNFFSTEQNTTPLLFAIIKMFSDKALQIPSFSFNDV